MKTLPTGTGWIEVVCGPMFSGKTEELIRRVRLVLDASQAVELFKPRVDDRYATDEIVSHSSQRLPARCIGGAEEMLSQIPDDTVLVGLDEAQFLGDDLPTVCQRLADRGCRVLVAGLDQDAAGRPFGSMPVLLALAEYVTKLSAVCVVCGHPASRSQRKDLSSLAAGTAGTEVVRVGGREDYEARCRRCHRPG